MQKGAAQHVCERPKALDLGTEYCDTVENVAARVCGCQHDPESWLQNTNTHTMCELQDTLYRSALCSAAVFLLILPEVYTAGVSLTLIFLNFTWQIISNIYFFPPSAD